MYIVQPFENNPQRTSTAEETVPKASGSVLTAGIAFPEYSKAVPVARKAVPYTNICTFMDYVFTGFYKYGTQNEE